jgi:hypothetical protein
VDNNYLKREYQTQMSCLLQYSQKRCRLHGELQYVSTPDPNRTIQRTIQHVPNMTNQHILIIDTGGGTKPTRTAIAWKVTHQYNVSVSMSGYQSKNPPIDCAVMNAITKVVIPGRMDPVIFEVNYATLIEDENEFESLVVPFDMMKHGSKLTWSQQNMEVWVW